MMKMKQLINKDISCVFLSTTILTQLRKLKFRQTRLAKKAKLSKEEIQKILIFLANIELEKKELEKLISKLGRNFTFKQLLKWLLLSNFVDFMLCVLFHYIYMVFFNGNRNAPGFKKILWVKHAICLFYFLYFPLKILVLILKIGFLKIKISKH